MPYLFEVNQKYIMRTTKIYCCLIPICAFRCCVLSFLESNKDLEHFKRPLDICQTLADLNVRVGRLVFLYALENEPDSDKAGIIVCEM